MDGPVLDGRCRLPVKLQAANYWQTFLIDGRYSTPIRETHWTPALYASVLQLRDRPLSTARLATTDAHVNRLAEQTNMVTRQTFAPRAAAVRRFCWLESALLLSVATLIAQLAPDFPRWWHWWMWPGSSAQAELSDAAGNHWQIKFLVCLPKDYSDEKRWPLLLYLHGSGQRGDDLSQVVTWGLPELITNGLRLPMIVVAPQCRADSGWNTGQLLSLLDHLKQRFAIDADRVSVCGESMGGYGTWALSGGTGAIRSRDSCLRRRRCRSGRSVGQASDLGISRRQKTTWFHWSRANGWWTRFKP